MTAGWSRACGRPIYRRLPDEPLTRIGTLLTQNYPGFGATPATEQFCELDRIKVSDETVRGMQIDLGLWRPKKRRAKRVFQLRERRLGFGELIRIDGSPHAWFEGQGPKCTLIVLMDDATERLTALHLAPVKSGSAYVAAMRQPCTGVRPPAGVLLRPARHLPGER